MPLAALLGQGGDALCDPGAVLAPEHVCVIGVRSFEPEEAALARGAGRARLPDARRSTRRGLDEVLAEALARVRTGTVGYGVTLDLDAIDPADAPGVTTPVAARPARGDARCPRSRPGADAPPLAVEIVEYEPHRDRGGATARLVEQVAVALLGWRRRRRRSAIDARTAVQRGELRAAAGRPGARRRRRTSGTRRAGATST